MVLGKPGSFEEEREATISDLSKKNVMTLATSFQDNVTARSVSTVVYAGKIYFQTDLSMEKSIQMDNNKNIALCVDDFSIVGIAKKIGTWSENEKILEAYKKSHLRSYENYKNIKGEVVFEITIKRIKRWIYVNNKPYIYCLDCMKKNVDLTPYI